jgi:GT2 family glycosyltransferase
VSANDPTVTIVVPTRGRPEEVRVCVEALVRAAGDSSVGAEIVVVDNNSEPSLGRITSPADSKASVAVIHEREVGASCARNAGLTHATTELVAFVDDDIVVSDGWLDALVEPFSDPRVVATVGPIVLECRPKRPRWLTDNLRTWYSALDLGVETRPLRVTEYGWSANMAVRREAALRVDGFDRRLGPGTAAPFGDDTDFLERVRTGGTIGYAARAVVAHRVGADRLSRRWLARRGYQQGLTDVARARIGGAGSGCRPVRALGAFAGVAVRGFPQAVRTARVPAHRPSLLAEQLAIRVSFLGAGVGWLRRDR